MSPRRGGEAGKIGNRYEFAWAVSHLLEVLAKAAVSVTLEEGGDLGEGVEFVVERRGGELEAHQVKRQRGAAHNWSVRDLRREGVLGAAAKQVAAGRSFHFVSLIPARQLNELTEQARDSDDVNSFQRGLSDELREQFDPLISTWGTEEVAWKTLRRLRVAWPDERHLDSTNAALAGLLLSGAEGHASAASLAALAERTLGVRLDAGRLYQGLKAYGLRPSELIGAPTIAETILKQTERWKASVKRELLDPPIPRGEADKLVEGLSHDADRVFLAAGIAGGGKSAVVAQVVDQVEQLGWPILAMRLDRIEQPFTSTRQLGARLDLPVSPVTALAATAQDRPALLVVDQLDAVSFASGRNPETFEAVEELLLEKSAFPEIRVLLACRQFDIDNDTRLRGLIAEKGPISALAIEPLSLEVVANVLERLNINPQALTSSQLELLRLPLNLVLLTVIADEPAALDFSTTKGLLDRYWDRKRRDLAARRDGVRFSQVVYSVVEAMSARQRLVVPTSILDVEDLLNDADVVASEHVLVRDRQQLAFFHEAFFDYAFARQWLTRRQGLVDFLLVGEQELFRRAQVRQVLVHLRDEDPDRFIDETRHLLTRPDVRFHVKDVVLGLLRSLSDPTTRECALVEDLLAEGGAFGHRLWAILRTPAWFSRLDAEGLIHRWLEEGADRRDRALEIMANAVHEEPARVAAVLGGYAGSHPDYPHWLQFVSLYAPIDSSRALLELVRDATLRGEYDSNEHSLWITAYGLRDKRPEWGCELLHAYLVERPSAMSVEPTTGEIADLSNDEHSQLELISKCADGAPRDFCELLLPYMREVMARTEYGSTDPPIHHRHFAPGIWKQDIARADDALLAGAARALRALAAKESESLRPLLEDLANDAHDGAQWLLYEGLKAAGPAHAEWAAEIMLEGEHRLQSGYDCSAVWTTRELLQALSPHVSDERFVELEQAVLQFSPYWERRTRGQASFTLLSALDEARLSSAGRRRLGELRRHFGTEQPEEPQGIVAGWVESPIPKPAAEKMSDSQWLGAMTKHAEDREDWQDFFRGGARELANVLVQETQQTPNRFARLSLRLDAGKNPLYIEAILQGLGQADETPEPDLVFEAIRHAARLDEESVDRWLAWALRRVLESDVPYDVIEIILGRALNSESPHYEAWLEEVPSGGKFYGGDPWSWGMNTARGSAAEILGDLIVNDTDGHRTELVAGSLKRLAGDPSIGVRTCVAHLIGASLKYAWPQAIEAFRDLVSADDRLLAANPVERLIVYVGFGDAEVIEPSIRRMLRSIYSNVREAGGRLAAFAGLEFDKPSLLEEAVAATEPSVRTGAATLCAKRLPVATHSERAEGAVRRLLTDEDEGVRNAAANVAGALAGSTLGPYRELILELIGSPTFRAAQSQLVRTLERAPDRVEDLALACGRRFVEEYRDGSHSIASAAALDAEEVGKLALRAFATSLDPTIRAGALDVLDELLMIGAYGIAELVSEAER